MDQLSILGFSKEISVDDVNAILGRISFDTFANASVSSVYDGVVTFTFDRNNKKVRFLYKLESNGIRLEETTAATIKDNVVTARGTNALVLLVGK